MPHPVALITGAAHRLGAHTAETLHARGWNVVIHYRGREQQARALADKLNQQRPEPAVCYQRHLYPSDAPAERSRSGPRGPRHGTTHKNHIHS